MSTTTPESEQDRWENTHNPRYPERVTVRLPKELLEAIDQHAGDDRSRSDVLRDAARTYVEGIE